MADLRILLVKLSSLGDVFHALPVAHALQHHFQARIDWVTQPENVDLVQCFEPVHEVLSFPRRDRKARGPFFKALRARGDYDMAIDLQGLLKSAWIVHKARTRRRIGPSFQREGARFLYHEIAGRRNKDRHAVDECLDVIRHLGLPDEEPVFPVKFREPAGMPAGRYAVLAPCSKWGAKDWPVDRFIAVGQDLRDTYGMEVLVVGGPDHGAVGDQVVAGIGDGATNWCGRTSLVELGGMLEQAAVLVCNDSGPMHMAAAVGTRVVALFGPTTPVRTGPWGPTATTVRPKRFDANPGEVLPFRSDDNSVMREIEVDHVLSAVAVALDS